MQAIIEQALAVAMDYPRYRQMLTDLLAEGKTTGPNQSPFYIKIADLNQRRMNRLDKRTKLTDALSAFLDTLNESYLLLTLTEGWCGDAAQSLPILNKIAEHSSNIELKFILRDEHLELMDQFLTDNGRSIPKVLVLDPVTHKVLTHWGPRPSEAQKISMDYKYQPEPKPSYEEHHTVLHTWYARDKTLSTQQELLDLFRGLASQEG